MEGRGPLDRPAQASLLEGALRAQPLESLDALSRTVTRRALALGGATGALFGIAGAAGLVADVPTLLTLAMRTIHRVGLCYGEKHAADDERRLTLGIFALVSANSAEEKALAVAALRSGSALVDAAWRDGVERITERELAKDATIYSLQNLARAIGLNLGKRKIAGSVPGSMWSVWAWVARTRSTDPHSPGPIGGGIIRTCGRGVSRYFSKSEFDRYGSTTSRRPAISRMNPAWPSQ